MRTEWHPQVDQNYLSWTLSSHRWSGEAYGEDTLKVWHNTKTGLWWGHTEADQCEKRDLDDKELVSIRREFGLDR